jgi:phosphoribosylamine-glycine ligase
MPLVQDHKRAYNEDKGPNTGGMGSYTDANHRLPFITAQEVEQALQITRQVLEALQEEEKALYKGILYGSFMASANGVYLIEYNVRFGDPEVINLLPLLENDFVEICQGITSSNLDPNQIRFKPLATVCKYLVPKVYPEGESAPTLVDISKVQDKNCLYYGSIEANQEGLWTLGSRTIAVLGVGADLACAEEKAEAEINRIQGELFHRSDIGKASLINQRSAMMQALRLKG